MTYTTPNFPLDNSGRIKTTLSPEHDGISNAITHDDDGGVDAFSRLRISECKTLFDFKTVSTQYVSTYWNSSTIGTASVTTDTQKARRVLSVGGATNDRAIHQTVHYFVYQPGKSQLILQTFNFIETKANVKKLIGYYDANNGIFLQQDGSTVGFVVRSNTSGSVVDNIITQNNWNVDKFDGTGPSRIVLDFTKAHILIIDMEWLGVGRVRCGFVVNGKIYYGHYFSHANVEENVYMATPNLPIRGEVHVTGTSSSTTMDMICSSVISEGSQHPQFIRRTADRGRIPLSTDNNMRPLISVRLKSTEIRANVAVDSANIITTTNSDYRWALFKNPTITGGLAASWQNVDSSSMQFDMSRDGTIASGQYSVASGYGSNTVDVINIEFDHEHMPPLGANIAGDTSDEYVLAVQNATASSSDDYYASISWLEYL